jgi:hypothetical protein
VSLSRRVISKQVAVILRGKEPTMTDVRPESSESELSYEPPAIEDLRSPDETFTMPSGPSAGSVTTITVPGAA